jgi:hypothetical protein
LGRPHWRSALILGLKAKGKKMGLLSSIELPHWLMIGGAILTTMSFLGLAFTRNK